MSKLQNRLCAALKSHLSGGRPRPPEGAGLLWRAFMALSATRSYHQFGPNPISHAEIAAYAALMRLPLAPHHVDILRAMDIAWLENAYGKPGKSAPEGVKVLPQRSSEPLTAALFDLVVR